MAQIPTPIPSNPSERRPGEKNVMAIVESRPTRNTGTASLALVNVLPRIPFWPSKNPATFYTHARRLRLKFNTAAHPRGF